MNCPNCKFWQWRTTRGAHSLQLTCSLSGTLHSLAEDPACHFPIGTIFPPDIKTSERRERLDVAPSLVDGETPIWRHTRNPTGALAFRHPGGITSADQITRTAPLPGASVSPHTPAIVRQVNCVKTGSPVVFLWRRDDRWHRHGRR